MRREAEDQIYGGRDRQNFCYPSQHSHFLRKFFPFQRALTYIESPDNSVCSIAFDSPHANTANAAIAMHASLREYMQRAVWLIEARQAGRRCLGQRFVKAREIFQGKFGQHKGSAILAG